MFSTQSALVVCTCQSSLDFPNSCPYHFLLQIHDRSCLPRFEPLFQPHIAFIMLLSVLFALQFFLPVIKILNGRTAGDMTGKYTCFKYNGCSVVDYIMVDRNVHEKVMKKGESFIAVL